MKNKLLAISLMTTLAFASILGCIYYGYRYPHDPIYYVDLDNGYRVEKFKRAESFYLTKNDNLMTSKVYSRSYNDQSITETVYIFWDNHGKVGSIDTVIATPKENLSDNEIQQLSEEYKLYYKNLKRGEKLIKPLRPFFI